MAAWKSRPGGDISTGQFFLASGTGRISAGGALNSSRTDSSNNPVGSLIAQGDSQLSVLARADVLLSGIIDPTYVNQAFLPGANQVEFFTYGGSSAIGVESVSGSVTITPSADSLGVLLGSDTVGSSQIAFLSTPPTLAAVALTGDLALGADMTIAPSSRGQLSVFAGRDIVGFGSTLAMSDAPPGSFADVQDPAATGSDPSTYVKSNFGAIHVGDTVPVTVAAGRDITGITLHLPKAANISAVRDITNVSLVGQNLNPGDVTVVSAGRDIVDTPDTSGLEFTLGGPGALDMFAGRNFNLGNASGVTTNGRLANTNIPTTQGAGINIWAGLGAAPDVSGYIGKVVAPSTDLQNSLVTFVEGENGQAGLSFTQAAADFLALPFAAQQPFLVKSFFGELLASGHAASDPKVGYTQGYNAIDALFPGSRVPSASSTPNPYTGDLQLPFSRIYTLAAAESPCLSPEEISTSAWSARRPTS